MKKTIILIVAAILFSATSCKDYLENSPTLATNSNFPTIDPNNPVLLVNAIYDAMSWEYYDFLFGNGLSDDGEKGSTAGDFQDAHLIEAWQANNLNSASKSGWTNYYMAIYRANDFLANLDKAKIDDKLKSRLQGEAYFLRGFAYFYLVKMFGGVPVLTAPPTSDMFGKLQRSSIAETYLQVEADIRKSIDLLPNKSEYANVDLGRATKGAAIGFLARAIMYQIGTDNSNNHTWQEVYDLTNQVIQSGQYSLVPNYATLPEPDAKNGPESIFEFQFKNSKDDGYANQQVGTWVVVFTNARSNWGWGFNTPTPDLINSFETGDPRLQNTVLRNGDILYGQKFVLNPTQDVNGALNRKMAEAITPQPSPGTSGDRNIIKMRYADVLLMNAEAAYYLGKSGESITIVNQIRARAKASTFPKGSTLGSTDSYPPSVTPANALNPISTSLSGQPLLDAIWAERRWEFGMEDLRFWDLVRTGRYLDIIANKTLNGFAPVDLKANALSHSITPGGNVKNYIPLMPIPVEDARFKLAQNPGY